MHDQTKVYIVKGTVVNRVLASLHLKLCLQFIQSKQQIPSFSTGQDCKTKTLRRS